MKRTQINNYLDETIKILKMHDPKEIILFGSVSKGTDGIESDIDLLVILDVDKIPETYEEKMAMTLDIRKSLRHINKKVSLDLLVYTKKEYAVMKTEKSLFLNEVNKTGRTVYEKAS